MPIMKIGRDAYYYEEHTIMKIGRDTKRVFSGTN